MSTKIASIVLIHAKHLHESQPPAEIRNNMCGPIQVPLLESVWNPHEEKGADERGCGCI